jgi:hypothetical protein
MESLTFDSSKHNRMQTDTRHKYMIASKVLCINKYYNTKKKLMACNENIKFYNEFLKQNVIKMYGQIKVTGNNIASRIAKRII